MPALSSNSHDLELHKATAVVLFIVLVSIGAIIICRKKLSGSIFSSASHLNASRMSTSEASEDEKTERQYKDSPLPSQQTQASRFEHSGHARSLSAQFPPPTLKPYLEPLSSASNAEYFNSPMTETPSTVQSPFLAFSPNNTYSQSTSFSESLPENSETDGPTRRRSYTKTLSLPLPNQQAQNSIRTSHPSAQSNFPAPTSRPYVEDGERGMTNMAEMDMPMPSLGTSGYSNPEVMGYSEENVVEVEFQGEIIVAEGWRRHTRVFGGGVCKACEESKVKEVERRGTS